MHSLLKRQLNRYLSNVDSKIIGDGLNDFINAVDSAYVVSDEDRKLVKHSLEISSRELEYSASLIRSVIDSIDASIVAIGTDKSISLANKPFLNTWSLGLSAGRRAYVEFLLSIQNNVVNPDSLIKQIESFPIDNKIRTSHVEFHDGRIFNVSAKEHIVHANNVGHVLVFHDMTDHVKTSKDLESRFQEIEKLNGFMVNRELDMLNLKRKVEDLENHTNMT